MDEEIISQLLNRITVRRYVNLHFSEYMGNKAKKAGEIVKEIIDGKQPTDYYVNVDIKQIPESQAEAGKSIAQKINDDLSKAQFIHRISDPLSVYSALEKLNKHLEKGALIIFHYFEKPDNEKEKDILGNVRKFIEMKDSLFLGILLISSEKILEWDLSPFSNFDERHVEFFPYKK